MGILHNYARARIPSQNGIVVSGYRRIHGFLISIHCFPQRVICGCGGSSAAVADARDPQTLPDGLLVAALPVLAAKGSKPEFGSNVLIFDPSMPSQVIQKQIDRVHATQEHNEFGPQRNALLFLPGSYSVDVPVGFYTEVMGLGASPDATRITGNVHADANHEHNNATTTFWRVAEGLAVVPAGGTMQWAVSQAVSLRRMHVRGDLMLHQHHGWASGGWMSDSLVDGNVDSGSQQQWISRNCDWNSWTGSNWNMVFVGVVHPPECSDRPRCPCCTCPRTRSAGWPSSRWWRSASG